jgi:hypothetical protein
MTPAACKKRDWRQRKLGLTPVVSTDLIETPAPTVHTDSIDCLATITTVNQEARDTLSQLSVLAHSCPAVDSVFRLPTPGDIQPLTSDEAMLVVENSPCVSDIRQWPIEFVLGEYDHFRIVTDGLRAEIARRGLSAWLEDGTKRTGGWFAETPANLADHISFLMSTQHD